MLALVYRELKASKQRVPLTIPLLRFVVCFLCFYKIIISFVLALCLQCFDAVGWAAGRASGL